MSLSRWLPRARAPYAVFIVGVALTLLGTDYILRTNAARDELHFQATADEIRHLIQIHIHTYIELLRAGVALFSASDTVTPQEFRAFVSHLRLGERYPGIQGIGFTKRVTALDGSIPVWPTGERDEYTSIVYLEPLDERNQRAIGYDMFSEPVRRAAMEKARDTGEPAASGRVTLVQEFGRDAQAGFLIYVPVYRIGTSPKTVEERREALVGYVYSPFRSDNLLHGILGPNRPALGVETYDGPNPDPANRMHVSAPADTAPSRHDALESRYTIDVAGRPWTLVFSGQRHFEGSSPMWIAPLTLAGGLMMTVALFAIVVSQYRARESAERHAAQLRASEEALRESESRLRRLVVLEREARAEAQAADRAKDEFLATLSHELRTPLNAMLGWITILRSGKIRPDRRVDALEVIERNAKTQARLIEDLLDVSRIITGKVQLDLQPMPLGPVVQTVLESLRPGAEAKGVHLHATVQPGLPAIEGDSARLQQVLWNLVSNAIKFTPAGGHVTLTAMEDDGGVQLSVSDTGIGIEADFLPHVFERFRQADSSTTRTHGGVGLGLAIVRHLVQLHGGRISARSEGRDRGSVFVVWLPTAHVVKSADNAPEHPVATPTI